MKKARYVRLTVAFADEATAETVAALQRDMELFGAVLVSNRLRDGVLAHEVAVSGEAYNQDRQRGEGDSE